MHFSVCPFLYVPPASVPGTPAEVYNDRPVPGNNRISFEFTVDATRPVPVPPRAAQPLHSYVNPDGPLRFRLAFLSRLGPNPGGRWWNSKKMLDPRFTPGCLETLLQWFPSSWRAQVHTNSLAGLRATLVRAAAPFFERYGCGLIDWARLQVVFTDHRYVWGFLGLFPEGLWVDVYTTVERKTQDDIRIHKAYLEELLRHRGLF